MKTRLNITIEDSLLDSIKVYASRNKISVSELVESYFRKITKPVRKKSIIEMVEKLEKPDFDVNVDLKELFYKEQGKKYGL